MTGFFADAMRPASVLRYPSLCADTYPRIVHTGAAYIKVINVSLLLIGICDRAF
jgi:hypothetical protein